MQLPVLFDSRIHGFSSEVKLNSRFTKMAFEAKKQALSVGEPVPLHLHLDGHKAAERQAYMIRKKPPRLWPSGRWIVVSRKISAEKSLLAVTFLGEVTNETAIIFEHPIKRGRPSKFSPEIPPNDSPIMIVHVDRDREVEVPDDRTCPFCGEVSIKNQVKFHEGRPVQVVACGLCNVDPSLIRTKYPVKQPPQE